MCDKMLAHVIVDRRTFLSSFLSARVDLFLVVITVHTHSNADARAPNANEIILVIIILYNNRNNIIFYLLFRCYYVPVPRAAATSSVNEITRTPSRSGVSTRTTSHQIAHVVVGNRKAHFSRWPTDR